MPTRIISSDDLDLAICCQDRPLSGFSHRSSFIKKLLTKKVWKMMSLFYIKQKFSLRYILQLFTRSDSHFPPPLLRSARFTHETTPTPSPALLKGAQLPREATLTPSLPCRSLRVESQVSLGRERRVDFTSESHKIYFKAENFCFI